MAVAGVPIRDFGNIWGAPTSGQRQGAEAQQEQRGERQAQVHGREGAEPRRERPAAWKMG